MGYLRGGGINSHDRRIWTEGYEKAKEHLREEIKIGEQFKFYVSQVLKRLTDKHKDVVPEIAEQDVEYYSWPCAFGSTAGPTGGIGGQQITNFQIHGFKCTLFGDGYLCCAGKYRYVSKFIPLMDWD